jgi:hypothetical protein
MKAVEVGQTHPRAPYDMLLPMRCRNEFRGRECGGRGGSINWTAPGTHTFRCPSCDAFNVVHVTEAAGAR